MTRRGCGIIAGMRRWVFKFLAALSFVLCAGAATLWVLSYTEFRFASHRGKLYGWSVSTAPGVMCSVSHSDRKPSEEWQELRPSVTVQSAGDRVFRGVQDMGEDEPYARALGGELWRGKLFESGFTLDDGSKLPVVNYWLIAIPYWWIVTASALAPTLAALIAVVRTVRRRKRAPKNRCPSCGYDMRATPDRCPECGAVPAAK